MKREEEKKSNGLNSPSSKGLVGAKRSYVQSDCIGDNYQGFEERKQDRHPHHH
jgi:hypothetical protein